MGAFFVSFAGQQRAGIGEIMTSRFTFRRALAPALVVAAFNVAPVSADPAKYAVCAGCHAAGVGGAPAAHDVAAWEPRVAKGMDTLVKHVKEGFQGEVGYMPPGMCGGCSDDEIKEIVTFMSTAK